MCHSYKISEWNFYSPNQDLLEIIPHVVNLQTSKSLIPSILGERSNTVIWHSYYVGLVRVLQVVGIFVCHIEENLLTAIAAMITVIVQIVWCQEVNLIFCPCLCQFQWQEAEEILEMLKSTWRVLGITQTIHDTCYTWVLFRQVNSLQELEIWMQKFMQSFLLLGTSLQPDMFLVAVCIDRGVSTFATCNPPNEEDCIWQPAQHTREVLYQGFEIHCWRPWRTTWIFICAICTHTHQAMGWQTTSRLSLAFCRCKSTYHTSLHLLRESPET